MVDKVCKTCKKTFGASRRTAEYCSQRCYKRNPEYKKWDAIYSKTESVKKTRRRYWNGPAGRKSWMLTMNRFQIKAAIISLTGKIPPEKLSISSLYMRLREAVDNNKEKARKSFRAGKPDCPNARIEYKIGIDFLRANQLVADILDGMVNKIRWFPSHDSIELMFQNKTDRSILFESYHNYLVACENKEIQPE